MTFEKFYFIDDKEKIVLIEINHESKSVCITRNANKYNLYLDDNDYTFLTPDGYKVLFAGLHGMFYNILENNFDMNEKNRRKFYYNSKFNEYVLSKPIQDYISKETELITQFTKDRIAYDQICDYRENIIVKIDKNKLTKDLISDKDYLIGQLSDLTSLFNSNKYKELTNNLEKDPYYKELQKTNKEYEEKLYNFTKSYFTYNEFVIDNYNKLFTKEYLDKMDNIADNYGIFLYCLNTPDYPILDPSVNIDDLYNFLLEEEAVNLKSMFKTFIDNSDCSPINRRESEDIIASYHLLLEGKYDASLRNLYALIEHHHILTANLFSGIKETKKKFKNGLERSIQIDKIFDIFNKRNYKHVWIKIDKVIEEYSKGKMKGKVFINRNSIVHGDYANLENTATAKDVVNLFTLYVTLRMMADDLSNYNEILKEIIVYSQIYKIKNNIL